MLTPRLTINFALAVLIFIFSIVHANADTPKPIGKVIGTADVVMPEWFKESFLDFREDALEASESNKHMLVFVHIKGCPYCSKMLKDNFTSSESDGGNREFIQQNFDSIDLNIIGSREVAFNESTTVTESELVKALKVHFTPTLLFMDANNKVVSRVNGYRSPREFKQVLNYVKEKAYEITDFPSYRQAHLTDSVYTLLDHPDFSEITNFEKALKSDKPLAILFEDKSCDDCERFHKEILDLPETKTLMKQYNFVRLDANSDQEIIDTEGNKTTANEWLKKEGISYRPSILFFSKSKERERLTGLIKSFHFQQLLSYIAKDKYYEYTTWVDYGGEYSEKILSSGKDIDIWK